MPVPPDRLELTKQHNPVVQIGGDLSVAGRPEIGEFSEGSGGGSSTIPHKNNPVLTDVLRRVAVEAPGLGATLHTASAASLDGDPTAAGMPSGPPCAH
ncbi:hypothetical protein [Gordonia sp. NPDC003950]